MKLSAINLTQRLYVMPEAGGYSCLGFDVLERRMGGYLVHLLDNGINGRIGPDKDIGTPERFEQYQEALEAVRKLYAATGIRCESELTPELVGLEGRHVEVTDCYGERRRFIVGKSTGFVPIHLEIERRNSSGGGGVTGAPFKSLIVID